MVDEVIKMPYEYNKSNSRYARDLRKNMTPEEKKLWYDFLKALPYTINRQKMIGPYIVDFYCHQARLAIELDGVQHYECKAKEYDAKRDKFLETKGIKVMRYANAAVHENFDGVCLDIMRNIEERV